mmetsp:Transcript_65332/g.211626  ORF Transcript_65332/g.211626 Transcript_65332/m.211626 type:complete len:245 (+) Transcript_65332:160-894(+)
MLVCVLRVEVRVPVVALSRIRTRLTALPKSFRPSTTDATSPGSGPAKARRRQRRACKLKRWERQHGASQGPINVSSSAKLSSSNRSALDRRLVHVVTRSACPPRRATAPSARSALRRPRRRPNPPRRGSSGSRGPPPGDRRASPRATATCAVPSCPCSRAASASARRPGSRAVSHTRSTCSRPGGWRAMGSPSSRAHRSSRRRRRRPKESRRTPGSGAPRAPGRKACRGCSSRRSSPSRPCRSR